MLLITDNTKDLDMAKLTPKIIDILKETIPVKLDQKGINPFKDLSLIKQYYTLFKSIKPDLILSYTIKPNIYGNLAARALKIPTINNICGLGTIFIKNNIVSYIGKLLYKIGLSSSQHVFFQNKHDRKLISQILT